MAGIFRVWCDDCDLEAETVDTVVWVLDDDGRRHVCPHPGELHTAERVTGLSTEELIAQKWRFRSGRALICLACGHLDHYEASDEPVACAGCGSTSPRPVQGRDNGSCLLLVLPLSVLVGGLAIGLRDLIDAMAAGGTTELSLAGPAMVLASVPLGWMATRLVRWESRVGPCPRCEGGTVLSEMVAIS